MKNEAHTVCLNPLCRRRAVVAFCCSVCAMAHRDGWELEDDTPEGTHPLLRHTDSCQKRREEHGLYED